MGKKEDAELLECFIEEAKGYILVLDKGVRRLASEADDKGLLEELLRIAHTMKGSAAFVNLTVINIIAKRIEDVLKDISGKKLLPDQDVIDTILFMLGAAGMVLRDVRRVEKDPSQLLKGIESMMEALLSRPVQASLKAPEAQIPQVDAETLPPPSMPYTDTTAPPLTHPPFHPADLESWPPKQSAGPARSAATKVTYWWEEPLEPMPLDAKKVRIRIMSKAISMGLVLGFFCGVVVGIWAYNYWKTQMEQQLAISEMTTDSDQGDVKKSITAQEVRRVLEGIRKANLAKEIDLYMSNFSKEFAGYDLKREQMITTWQGYDFISLTYSLKKTSIIPEGAKTTVVWNFTVKDKATGSVRKFKTTHFITFKRQGEDLRIIALRQQDNG